MLQNSNLKLLQEKELISINGGSDCPLNHGGAVYEIGRVFGYAVGVTVVTVLSAFKIIAEKVI